MGADILGFKGITFLPLPPKQILEKIAKDEEITHVLVLTYRNNTEFEVYSSYSEPQLANYMCDILKSKLMNDEFLTN